MAYLSDIEIAQSTKMSHIRDIAKVAGIDEKSLVQAVETAISMNEDGAIGIPVPDYIEENVSTKVVKIIQSYTGVVDKMVWRKF